MEWALGVIKNWDRVGRKGYKNIPFFFLTNYVEFFLNLFIVEFEPLDLDKKEYINGELTNLLHETVQEVALKRKHCPSKYKSSLSRLTTGELGRLVSNNHTLLKNILQILLVL